MFVNSFNFVNYYVVAVCCDKNYLVLIVFLTWLMTRNYEIYAANGCNLAFRIIVEMSQYGLLFPLPPSKIFIRSFLKKKYDCIYAHYSSPVFSKPT